MKAYSKVIIYYFSGTGNAENVALWISSVAQSKNISCQINNIANINRLAIETPPLDALIIFVSPIHGFNYPPIMLNFIHRFPKGRNNIILLNTRAGMLIGKYITPGLTGIAFYLSLLIFKLKGYTIKGMIPVDMPSNWMSIHPGLKDKTVNYLHKKNKERVIISAEKFLSGKNDFKALKEIAQDIIISPVSILYYFIGRYVFAKTFYTSRDCNDCELCINNCPVKAIIKVNKRPFWTYKCESCMRCMNNCPKKSIETAHGFIIILMFIVFNTFLLELFFKYFESYIFKIENNIIRFVVKQFLFIILLTVCYRMVHYLLRFKIIERFMVYTSLTKYKFWGRRYKALKNF